MSDVKTESLWLMHGNCLDRMKEIPDGSVDMVLADPPYGTTACKWDSIIPLEPMWEQLKRIVKPNGAIVLFGSEPFSSALRMSNAKQYRYDWVWNKVKGGNFAVLKYQPYKTHENVMVFSINTHNYYPIKTPQIKRTGKIYSNSDSAPIKYKDGLERIYNDKHPKSIIEFSNANQKGKQHPTQKPVALMEYLIKTYTNEGETVIDFSHGSGSTGVASVNTGRKYIGIEMDDHYFSISKERILNTPTT